MMGGIKVICFLVLILCVSLAGRGGNSEARFSRAFL